MPHFEVFILNLYLDSGVPDKNRLPVLALRALDLQAGLSRCPAQLGTRSFHHSIHIGRSKTLARFVSLHCTPNKKGQELKFPALFIMACRG
jgi:hypothetical protein